MKDTREMTHCNCAIDKENMTQYHLAVKQNLIQRCYPDDLCIHQLFEEQVERTPEKPAVSFGKRWVSYQELNARANRLAHHLRVLGVGAETLVGVCIDRSIDMIVALLAVLKAGGAYLPLDPAYPVERLTFMLHDSQTTILLSTKHLSTIFNDQEVKIIHIDAEQDALEHYVTTDLLCNIQPHNLAYVIYTSGSTGRPKGVLVTHRSLVNHAIAFSTHFSLQPDDRALQFFSISFDAAAEEIFPTLISGATVILQHERVSDPLELLHFLIEERITLLNLPTAYWHLWVSQLLKQSIPTPSSLRLVVVGGEKVSSRSFLAWQKWAGTSIRWANTYGPTETTITATIYEPASFHFQCCNEASIPIGHPIANTRVYVLDTSLQSVPVGVAGELYISGAGLARGYLNRPELTRERFMACPFDPDPQARMYRTGDLVRYLPDGQLEFIGRVDQQVKIRGFRIELGEIEAVLCLHPAIKEAVVLAREDADDDKSLVAYLIHDQALSSPSARELRTHLRQRLPDYMLPVAFVYMNIFPLTLNGKVDHNALPEPDQSQFSTTEHYVAPRTSIEQTLALMWKELLRCEPVGIYDSFFDMGGHSLLATLLTSRIRETFHVEISLHNLFNMPTISSLAEQIESLQQENHQVASSAPIQLLEQQNHVPLSFGQQQLWVEEQLMPGSCTYTIPLALRLSGPLNIATLQQALQQVTLRHQSFRTHFEQQAGEPVQIIAPMVDVFLTQVDLSMVASYEQESYLQESMQQQVQRPFDLSQGPLFRATLFCLHKHEYLLLLCMHHIIFDGWSINILLHELAILYEAAINPSSTVLSPPLPFQYTDFALWQRQRLQGEILQQHLNYWNRQLSGTPALLALPLDHPRPNRQTLAGASLPFTLSAEITRALRRLAHQEGVSLFMVLLAAFQLLLARYSGQQDIVLGTPIANRTRRDLEEVIGFFVNTLVLRTDLSGNPSLHDLLARVRTICLQAYAHQDLPFERLVEELKLERNPSYSPLVQVLFVLQNTPLELPTFPEVSIRLQEIETQTAKFDLTIELTEEGEQLQGRIEYKTDLFECKTIERLVGHWQVLLEGMGNSPAAQFIGSLPLPTEAEREQILRHWNATWADYPQGRAIHYLFEEQVERTPKAIAVVCGHEQVSYHELNRRANRLAHYLHTQGVGPDVLVGICLERSVEMVVALFAVLKAGGAYVPLDPAYPSERLAFILHDSQVMVVLTSQRLKDALGSWLGNIVCLDGEGIQMFGLAEDNPHSGVAGHHLAYVIYTSGSTGKPKGVLIEHEGLCNVAQAQAYTFKVQPGDRVLQFASLNFDASVFELLMALLAGASLHLGTQDALLPGPALHRFLQEQAITHATLTPAVLKNLPSQDLPKLQTVISAGEMCSPDILAHWAIGRHFFNAYGPTEITIWATTATCSSSGKVTIGHPIFNTHIYILDQYMQPVPVGIAGELYISGAGLARGYLNQPELTRERFMACPFDPDPQARMYRTGDLVRYLPDGQLEFIGRVDQQVKIRGFRIELGEIETVLCFHPAIKEAVVLAREDEVGDKQLIAYVVSSPQQELPINELRTFLLKQLPNYMVPQFYVTLSSLPLTPNGKVNYHALPSPKQTRQDHKKVPVAPANAIEEALVEIWSGVLRVDLIGTQDNFFELGGHSLLATQVISRIRERFEVDVPVHSIFDEPTIASLAVVIVQLRAEAADAELLAQVLAELDNLSEDEVKSILFNIPQGI